MPSPELDVDIAARDKGGEWDLIQVDRFRQAIARWIEAVKIDSRQYARVERLLVPAENDIIGILRLGHESAEFSRRHLRDSYSAEPGQAVRDEDEESPGRHKIIFRTRDGVETLYRGLPVEGQDQPQQGVPAKGQPLDESDETNQSLSHNDRWKVLTNSEASATSRVAALTGLRGSPLESVSLAYLAEELGRADHLQPEWRDAAIFAAEDRHFPPKLREGLGEALLNIASSLRNEPDGEEKVVWSALRRGASLLPTTKVDRLLAFLAPGGTVDTRSVALQCISRMYEVEPPSVVPPAVADRAYRFAERFLDPDVFTPGEPSLIARNAVSALAAMGDQRLGNTLTWVRDLGRPWLTRRVRDELNRVNRAWAKRGFRHAHPAVANLGNALALLG